MKNLQDMKYLNIYQLNKYIQKPFTLKYSYLQEFHKC